MFFFCTFQVNLHVNNMDISFPHQVFYDNEFWDSSDGVTFNAINPTDESVSILQSPKQFCFYFEDLWSGWDLSNMLELWIMPYERNLTLGHLLIMWTKYGFSESENAIIKSCTVKSISCSQVCEIKTDRKWLKWWYLATKFWLKAVIMYLPLWPVWHEWEELQCFWPMCVKFTYF